MACTSDLKHLTSQEFVAGKPLDNQNKALQEFIQPHIESFNYILENGLNEAVKLIIPQEFELPDGRRAEISILDCSIGTPVVDDNNFTSKTQRVYPAECRERHCTYKAKLTVTLQWKINGVLQGSVTKSIAQVPVMVKSKNCSLANLTPAQLIEKHEEAEEWGGYFIVNGIEKILRMLVMQRRNYPLAMVRKSWKSRGPLFTEFGVSIRSIQKDQSGNINVLHYLTDGSFTLSFIHQKEQFFVPLALILKALTANSDQYIYKQLLHGKEDDIFFKDVVVNMLRTLNDENLLSQNDVLKYMGMRFRIKVNLPEWTSDEDIAKYMFQTCVLVHLEKITDKFNLLIYMTQKLFALANDKCAAESPDNPMNHEVLLGGHTYLLVLKDKLETWLNLLKPAILKEINNAKHQKKVELSQNVILSSFKKSIDIGKQMESFLATGNILSKSGLGLMQATGMSVVADKLNFMRYLSHFRCIHRGAFFTEMRTTTVRKLLPEAWGFLCPVHTPDGAPCGLLNHLAAACKVENTKYPTSDLIKLLVKLGMQLCDMDLGLASDSYSVLLDGCVVGRLRSHISEEVCKKLRVFKALQKEMVPPTMEIIFIPRTKFASQYEGIFLFTDVARMIRPVRNLLTNTVEYIGSFEQVYMDIAVYSDEIHAPTTTHMELNDCAMLSELATLTPYSDFNQSPRNMYQCQMGKQTMGTPCQALKHRSDNKMYKIQTPQAPLVRNKTYSEYGVDNFPLGTNAVVAVISYTGYDMEDAMIINKSSLERGFCHGQIYKTELVDLEEKYIDSSGCAFRFGSDEESSTFKSGLLGKDGLPPIGRFMQHGDPYYSYYHIINGEYKTVKYKHMEPAYIDDIKILGSDKGDRELLKVSIKLRIQRNPIIGDKFASRHGQKGILSVKWPAENMPFTESGMIPDIIFNPHGFPSRMTIGMMIESMAGKSAALHGITHDSTPFIFSEEEPAAHYMGEILVKAGYNYYGNERMYSGINGKEMDVDIFIGIVYYQRLRHMVADKYQVRSTGPVDNLTHQPVQGRKRQGGIRFGEMERDALIAHGSGFLLHDRLFNCSDRCETHVCTKCGSIFTPIVRKPVTHHDSLIGFNDRKWFCRVCGHGDDIQKMLVPYVFKYLIAELTAMNIRLVLDVK
ncbi:DNA-directed RNA polymerase I subunit RPA2 isoform X2 [Hydra vulgaris]|uniref:DNA-directed RNA polymerase I subunit RPA2 isoform X2 n=1 Tax=Hydra vulgaris TaxID=6087 RepID=UPI001F5F0FDA|nr:DNA-directed RNA polymerase I subunit RPA2 isoform X2 [Hydra vulgaris]